MARKADAPWTLELEAALTRELRLEWDAINRASFRKRLAPPSIELTDHTSTLGRWVLDRRALELSRALVLEQPWPIVVEVLKHEMAHQYVHEALGIVDETAHGPRFRDVCEKVGIDPAASGLPVAASEGAIDEERILDRVRKLLALADSPNRNEAESAMAAAQRLLLKHNLEVRDASHARGYAHRHLGTPTGRVSESDRRLAGILDRHFFVDAIWIPVYRPREALRGSVLEVCGTPSNLEIAEYVHGFLRDTAERLWRDHQIERGIRSHRDRRTYLAGVMAGFSGKLDKQEKQVRNEGLVWVRDADLDDFFRKRHPRVRITHYGGGGRREAFAHGQTAGARIELHPGMSPGGASGAVVRGRLLKM